MFRRLKKRIWFLGILLILIALFFVQSGWENSNFAVTKYTVESNKIPQAFSGYKIIQVSDLHNKDFGSNNRELLDTIAAEQPDIIVLTGDMIDVRRTKPQIALDFISEAVTIAPTYYVPGNHEADWEDYDSFRQELLTIGVIVLEDQPFILEKGEDKICLAGLTDPNLRDGNPGQSTMHALEQLALDTEKYYTILLSHRPEFYTYFQEHGIDLILSGHTHGGQIRLPFFGAFYIPNQGFFPEYDAGMFIENNSTLIISKGLGNSRLPIRFLCRPELIVIQLTCENF